MEQATGFKSWFEDVTSVYQEAFEVRKFYVPKINWIEYFQKGFTPNQAVETYLASRFTR